MIAMAWRQHRAQLLVSAALIGAVGGYLLASGLQMSSYQTSIGLSHCLSVHGQCDLLAEAFFHRFGGSAGLFSLLDLLPLLAGMFWGAPLIARETERGTHRMAWTQAVSRGRWLAVKLAVFTGAAVIAAAVVALLLAWWLRPFDRLFAINAGGNVDRMAPGLFDLSGIVPAASTLFAFALGAAAGALIRRTIPAMAVALGGYLAVWLPLGSWRYRIFAPATAHGPFGRTPSVPVNAYVLANSYTNAAGHPVSFASMAKACMHSHGAERGVRLSCLAAKGYRFSTTYQPDSRFWPIQGVESGILLAAAVLLLAIAVWWTARRIS
jgi:ABC-2 family transporter protein